MRTGWRRLIGSPKLQIIFHKRATKYRALLRKMSYKDKGSYESSPPCTILSERPYFGGSSLLRHWIVYSVDFRKSPKIRIYTFPGFLWAPRSWARPVTIFKSQPIARFAIEYNFKSWFLRILSRCVTFTPLECECRSVLQFVAMRYSVLQCVVVCWGVFENLFVLRNIHTTRMWMWWCVAVCCSMLQCVAVCCSVLQCVAVCCCVLHMLQYVAVRYSVLQCPLTPHIKTV